MMPGSIQQVIQDMLNSVLPTVNTPGGQYYLPTWIQTNGYDPYGKTEAMTWAVSLSDQAVIQTAASICAQIDQGGEPCSDPDAFYIAAPGTQPKLVLGGKPGDLLISGFSNAYMASMTSQASDPYTIIAVAQFSTLPNYAPNAVISGVFTFTEYCCCSDDQKVCTTTPDAQTGSGTFTATVNGSATATITFKITDLAPGVLTIGVQGVNIVPPMKGGNPAITITIDITSIPKNVNSQTYNDAAMEAFNSSQGLNNIVSQMNAIMNQPAQLNAMGNILTQVIDGYLKNSHQYPFNTASLALV
jgi:hypothetical protein